MNLKLIILVVVVVVLVGMLVIVLVFVVDYVQVLGVGLILVFVIKYDGEVFIGSFLGFVIKVSFDLVNLVVGLLDVVILFVVVKSGNSDCDLILQGVDFFNVGKFVIVCYIVKGFCVVGNDQFVVDGMLELCGVSKLVMLIFIWKLGIQLVLIGKVMVK